MKLNKQDTNKLINWIEKHHDKCINPNHTGYCRGWPNINKMDLFLVQTDFPFDAVAKLEKDIYEHFNFSNNVIREPNFGWFLSYSTEGHKVVYHTDPLIDVSDDYSEIVRINFMLKKPKKGGEPIISKKLIKVDEGGYWICHASGRFHTSEEIVGDIPRIVLSMGYAFTLSDFLKFKKQNEI